jgi:hypothetical protein
MKMVDGSWLNLISKFEFRVSCDLGFGNDILDL